MVVYNRAKLMLRRLPSVLLIALALLVCFATAGSAVRRAQNPAAPQDFPRAAATAIAHGKRDDAARLATARGAGDPAAAVVLAQLAAARGEYKEAQSLLEAAVPRDPAGDAALELALLYRSIGRAASPAGSRGTDLF